MTSSFGISKLISLFSSHFQILALVPVYLLQLCYGMNTGFPAILTPQLRENCSEFPISVDEESWIVSIDNLATPLICILSGFLQQKFGPLRVSVLLILDCVFLCRRSQYYAWICSEAFFAALFTVLAMKLKKNISS